MPRRSHHRAVWVTLGLLGALCLLAGPVFLWRGLAAPPRPIPLPAPPVTANVPPAAPEPAPLAPDWRPPPDAVRQPNGEYRDPQTGGVWVDPNTDPELGRILRGMEAYAAQHRGNRMPCGHPWARLGETTPYGYAHFCRYGHRYVERGGLYQPY